MDESSLDVMADPIPDTRDAVEYRGWLVESRPRSRSWENPPLSSSDSFACGLMVAFSFPLSNLVLLSCSPIIAGSKLRPTGDGGCLFRDSAKAVVAARKEGPASDSSTGEGVMLRRFSSYEWRTDRGRLTRCSLPALRSIWRLARFEGE